jgi:hypothetical protein
MRAWARTRGTSDLAGGSWRGSWVVGLPSFSSVISVIAYTIIRTVPVHVGIAYLHSIALSAAL